MTDDKSSNLGCYVIGRSAERRRQVIDIHLHSAHAHVGQTHVAAAVQHDVVQLQVSAGVGFSEHRHSKGLIHSRVRVIYNDYNDSIRNI